MLKILNIVISTLIPFFVLALTAQGEHADGKAENIQQVIMYLIEEVARSNLTFIRNGEMYSSEEASKHILKKYEYFKSRIESPEDFIRLCASKSLISGEPYLLITPQGNITVESWLSQVLMAYRGSQGTPEPELP